MIDEIINAWRKKGNYIDEIVVETVISPSRKISNGEVDVVIGGKFRIVERPISRLEPCSSQILLLSFSDWNLRLLDDEAVPTVRGTEEA